MTETAGDFPVSYWRALLDARWQAEVRRVTELSLAFCGTAEQMQAFAGVGRRDGDGRDAGELRRAAGRLRRAESRAVAARRSLADIEEAMSRLTAGRYGRCEQCGTDMPARWLTRVPETRYCPRCSPGAAATARLARSPVTRPALARVLMPLAARLRRTFHAGVIYASPGNG
jgi:RNA polymerase-binding transcription factor DksA